jgi:4-amino-4-deoxy-L-arabinose transferase-like glycosyltransferase
VQSRAILFCFGILVMDGNLRSARMDRWSRSLLTMAIAACIAGIYIYPLSLRTPLMDPDEGIHATIAQEMVERGDYVIPRYLGVPFRDKPILYSASQAVSLRIFGLNEAAVRLPGVLFALLGCATTALLAWRMFDSESVLYAALASLTLVLPAILTQSPAHDVALVPFVNLFILSFWEQETATNARRHWIWVLVMSASVALAILTKGLIGLAVIAPGIAAYALLTRRLSRKLIVSCTLALISGGLLASPWFIAMERVSPGYLYYYFIDRHLLGFVTEGQLHGDSAWYYYVGPVLGGAMPWLMFALAGVLQYRSDNRRVRNPATVLLACWFVGGFLFLCVAGSKLLTYSLPLFPPVAVLAGVGFRRFFHNELTPMLRRIFINTFRVVSVLAVLSPIAMLLVLRYFLKAPSPPIAYVIGFLASAAIATGLVLMERGYARAALAVGMMWFPLIFITVMTWPVQLLAAEHSQKALAEMINARSEQVPHNLVLVGQRIGSVVFYLSPVRREVLRAGRMWEDTEFKLKGLLPPPLGTFVAIRDEHMRKLGRTDEIERFQPILAGPFHVLVPRLKETRVAERPDRNNQ